MKKPTEKYIRRANRVESVQLRIDSTLKRQMQQSAKKLNSSMNRFTEAALHFYIDALKKEGVL